MKFSRGIRAKLAAITRSVVRSYFSRILPQFIVNYFIHSDMFAGNIRGRTPTAFKASRARSPVAFRNIPQKRPNNPPPLSLSLFVYPPQSLIPRITSRENSLPEGRGARDLRQRTSARNRENENASRANRRDCARQSQRPNYVRLRAGDVRCHGWRVFREHSGREIRRGGAGSGGCWRPMRRVNDRKPAI